MKHTRPTGTFTARTAAGREQILHIYTRFEDAATPEDRYAVVAVGDEFRTPEGLAVTRLAKGAYQVAQTGLRLYSDDPDAP